MKKKVGRPIDGRTQAKLYWSEKVGCAEGEIHPTVAEAVMIDPSLCERAWARLRDKEDAARNRDLEQAQRVRHRQAFFVWALKQEIETANKERHARKMRRAQEEEAAARNRERRQDAINKRVYQK